MFKVGDRVRYVGAQGLVAELDGEKGTVKYIQSTIVIVVEFDNPVGVPSKRPNCKPGHGYKCSADSFELIRSANRQMELFK